MPIPAFTVPLADVITDLAGRAGVDPSQVDVSQITTGSGPVAPSVIEIARPTNWTRGLANGKDTFGAYLDNDQSTAWLFQYFLPGFAHVRLSDGSIIFQGNFKNNVAIGDIPTEREDGTPMWLQDGTHYFNIDNNNVLHKMQIGSGTVTDWGNGYLVDLATLNCNTFSLPFDQQEDWAIGVAGGVTYISMLGNHNRIVNIVNATTMAFVGSFTAPGTFSGTTISSYSYWATFFDANGDVWFMVEPHVTGADPGGITGGIFLCRWHPADGATAGVLNNVHVNFVSAATLGTGTRGAQFACYNPANHSVVLGNNFNWTGDMIVVDLLLFTRLAFALDAGTLFYGGTFDAPLSAMDTGVQGGVLAVPGDTNLSNAQFGGIVNLIDPATLAIVIDADGNPRTYNVSALIDSSATPDKAPRDNVNGSRGINANVTAAVGDGLHITYTSVNSFVPGQLVTVRQTPSGIFDVLNATVVSATGTQFVIASSVLHVLTSTPGAKAGAGICPFANMKYNATLNGVLVTYEFIGSPAFFISLGSSSTPGLKVSGYVVTNQTDAKTALQNLMAAYFIDCVESDFKLKFVPRGVNAAALTIPELDLGLANDKAEIIEQTAQEQDLPREVSVLFIDPNIDWQQNKSQKHRHRRGLHTKQLTTMQLPMVFTPEEARQIAEKALYLAYLEGKPFSINLWKAIYMALDPTDIINFIYQGNTFQVRLANGTIGVDYTSQLNTVSDDPNNYLANPAAGTADGVPPNIPPPPAPSVLFLFDVPYLRDTDAVADRSHTGFYAGVSSPEPTWSGAVLNVSSDGTDYDAIGSSADRMFYGTVTSAPLGAPPSLWTWDMVNTIDVTMANGSLSGTTDANVLNGANVLIVGGEVIQYVNAVLLSPNVYRLSRLLRGRRNTEYAAFSHVASELAVDPTTGIFRQDEPLVLIGLLRDFKAVTVGGDITLVTTVPLTLAPGDLKPASPVRVTGVRDISANLTIGWIRRTRYAGDWLNNTANVPLNEDVEAYEIDVMNGITVVRTIVWTPGTYDANGNPTAAYTAAQQTTDFGSPQAQVTVKIYQISAQVGRGFPAVATI